MAALPVPGVPPDSPFRRNLPLFIAFRVLFNARFYYPVIGVLFLDLGLTLEQYAILNVIWAVAIVVLEIPSGALADTLGRKKMVVLAAVLMVVEMLIFAFAPTGNVTLLFWLLALNRVISGAAEAAASGADEALAYDSLPPDNRDTAWPKVLESLMRWKSGAFFVAMISGAALFDAAFLQSILGWTGWVPESDTTVRWPVFATLVTSFFCLGVALALREPPAAEDSGEGKVGAALGNVLRGARHVFTTRRILLLLMIALLCDSFIRLFLTFASNFYRLIELPEVANGVLGSTLALLGFLVAPVAKRMVLRYGPVLNFSVVVLLVLTGLTGVALAVPVWGVWVVLPLGLSMAGLQFFISHYLNLWTQSSVRATVLSFRGVAFNLGYGVAGLAFAALTTSIRSGLIEPEENLVFGQAVAWFPAAFALSLTFFFLPLVLMMQPGGPEKCAEQKHRENKRCELPEE